MTVRTTRIPVTFRQPFALRGSSHRYPRGTYTVVTDEELIDGLSFLAYRRVSTTMVVPTPGASSTDTLTIDPADLAAAQARDVAD